MSKFYQTREFKELEREWSEKLSREGFIDAERTKNGERVLLQHASNAYRQARTDQTEATMEYFRSVSHHFYITSFPRALDKCVMMLWIDGVTIKGIVHDMQFKGIPIHRQTVRFIIRRWEHEWGIRFWPEKKRYPCRG